MSAGQPPRAGGGRVLARAALGLYPPAWRARYSDEVLALLEDSGAGLAAGASLAWHAAAAWACPPRHLHDRRDRMRASLVTVGMAWALLAGLGAVFAQLTQAQGQVQAPTLARHPVITWSYWAFDACQVVSVLAVAVGGVPLWLVMLRRARRARRRSEVALLLAAAVVPAAYLAAGTVVVALVRGPGRPVVPWESQSVVDLANGGVGARWFLALVLLGFAAALVSAAGPALALRRLRPHGRVLVLAVRAGFLAAVTMGLAGTASAVAAVGLYLWAPPYAGYHEAWPLAVYLPAVLLAAAVAVVSAARGTRAASPGAAA